MACTAYFRFEFLGNINTVLLTLIGSSLIIAGSCAINNWYDRDIDHVMERTKVRPTVTGKIQPNQALWSGILLVALGLIMLLMTTVMAAVIGFIGVFTYVVLYTMWTKRRYTINTVVGSVSGAVPPLIGWTAVEGNIGVVAWVLFMILFIWQIPHFLALAIKKTEDYRAANIPMLPVVYGFEVTKRQIIVWVACLMPLPFSLKPWPSDCHPRLAVKYWLADSRLNGLSLQEYHEVGNADVRLLA